ncbi:conserved hypothetical protein [Aeropyrum pernix K1]|uniref:PIN domain-containing protein n=1 Tax=Aeropyrum pernix (strain ATCC 700893 / DSM 11879 / JCM 9820 / NBRC 100138 / K1) TaxID=272557 RepID=Q05E24_AERPE|nr:type II toxin-antitoxin system VapC family toxin [Aeropyrum pernix]BAF34777.1 conserved hypothetical protein [Aeropyrum pernix K1]
MRRLFVDANIFIRIIFNREHSLLEYLIGTEPYTSTHLLEEAAYKLIALSIIESEGPVSVYKIGKLFEKGAAEDTIRARLAALDKIAEKLNIIPPTYSDFRESMKISLEYKLLPSDALTVAIMKREEIKEILTLDNDFKQIP